MITLYSVGNLTENTFSKARLRVDPKRGEQISFAAMFHIGAKPDQAQKDGSHSHTTGLTASPRTST